MATKHKQKKRNAFSVFLDEYVEKQRIAGRKISHRIGAEECALIWEKMPPEEKQQYSEMASVTRVYSQKEKETKFTTWGVSYAEMDKKVDDERRKVEKGNLEIERTIENLDWDTIRKHLFYIIHCHYLVKLEDGTYMPGEIAICEFNLELGIRKTYHRLINSGPLPIGYGYEAKLRRESVHDLPIPPYEDGVSDYLEILNDIFRFIESGRDAKGHRPPFYATENDIPAIENILLQFSNKVGQGENFFRVLPIHKMFYTLKNKCTELANLDSGRFSVMSIALVEIEKDTYRYVSGISCQYHTSDEFYHACSLSIVQRLVYMICEHCCQYLKIPLKPGKHIRQNADGNVDEEDASHEPKIPIKEEYPSPDDEKAYDWWDHPNEKPRADSKSSFKEVSYRNRSARSAKGNVKEGCGRRKKEGRGFSS